MFCPQCGTENPEGSAFCRHCGTRIADAAGAAQPGAGAVGGDAPQAGSAGQGFAAQDPYGQQPYGGSTHAGDPGGSYGTGQPGGGYYGGASQQPYQYPVSAGGCLTAAWDDVTKSEGWVGKACLLGIVNAVPILNWVVMGYILRWARQLAGGIRQPLPKGLFVDRAFVIGFFAAVVGVIAWVVSWVVSAVVVWVPLFGALAALAFSVLFNLFVDAAIMRMAIVDRLGAAFDIGRVWRAYKRGLGSLFCASVIPGIIAGIVILVLVVVSVMIIGLFVGSGSGAAAVSVYAAHHGAEALVGLPALFVATGGVGSAIVLVVLWVLCAMTIAVSQLVSYRAVGHWAARIAPDWGAEAPEARAAYQHAQPPYGQPPYQG